MYQTFSSLGQVSFHPGMMKCREFFTAPRKTNFSEANLIFAVAPKEISKYFSICNFVPLTSAPLLRRIMNTMKVSNQLCSTML